MGLTVAAGGIVAASQPVQALECAVLDCSGADKEDGIMNLLKWVLRILTGLVGIAAVGGVIWAGILYTSAGDKADQVKKAKTIIIDVVIGIVAYGNVPGAQLAGARRGVGLMKAKLFVFLAVAFTSFTTATAVVSTPAVAASCTDSLLGIPAWYSGLQKPAPGCDIVAVGKTNGSGVVTLNVFITKVALNIVRAALVLVGYIAVFFIIKGGFLYIIAGVNPVILPPPSKP